MPANPFSTYAPFDLYQLIYVVYVGVAPVGLALALATLAALRLAQRSASGGIAKRVIALLCLPIVGPLWVLIDDTEGEARVRMLTVALMAIVLVLGIAGVGFKLVWVPLGPVGL